MGLQEGLVGVPDRETRQKSQTYLNRANLDKKLSSDRKSTIKESLAAILSAEDDDDSDEYVIGLKTGDSGIRRAHSSEDIGELQRQKLSLNQSKRQPLRKNHSGGELEGMKSALEARSQGTPLRKKVGRSQSGEMLSAMHSAVKSALLPSQKKQQEKPKASAALDDPFIDYLLGSYQPQNSPGTLGTPSKQRERSNSPRKFKISSKIKFPDPLKLSGHLKRGNSDGVIKRDRGQSRNLPKSNSSRERTAKREERNSLLQREAGCPRSSPIDTDDISLSSSDNDKVRSPGALTPNPERPSIANCGGSTGESWLSLETEVPLVSESFQTPTSRTRQSRRSRSPSRSVKSCPQEQRNSLLDYLEQSDANLLGPEMEMALVDNSSQDPAFETPQAGTPRRYGSTHSRSSIASASPGSVAPPPVISTGDADDWLGGELEVPMVDNSDSPNSVVSNPRRRSRSLGDAVDMDAKKKSPGNRRRDRHKSHSPGKNKDRKKSSGSRSKDKKSKNDKKTNKRDKSSSTQSRSSTGDDDHNDQDTMTIDVMCDDFFGMASLDPISSKGKRQAGRSNSLDGLKDLKDDDGSHCNMMMMDSSVHGLESLASETSGDDLSCDEPRNSSKKIRKSRKIKYIKSSPGKGTDRKSSKSKKSKERSRSVEREAIKEAISTSMDFSTTSDEFRPANGYSTKRSENGSFRRRSFDCVHDANLRAQHAAVLKDKEIVASALINYLISGSPDDDQDSDIESSEHGDEEDIVFEDRNMFSAQRKSTTLKGGHKKLSNMADDSFRGLSTFGI